MIHVDREERVGRRSEISSLSVQILGNHFVDPLGLHPDGFWLAGSTSRNDEIPGIDPIGYLDLACMKPVDRYFNQAAGGFCLRQVAYLETFLVFLAVVTKADEENL